jgi:hypothetical protein
MKFYDSTSDRTIDVADDDVEAQERFKKAGLVSTEAKERSGGALDTLLTVPETAAATASETFAGLGEAAARGIEKMTGFGSAPGLISREGKAATGKDIGPDFAYTPEALERREVNTTAAKVGAAVPEVAASLIPGTGWAGLAARSIAAGALAEGGETAITGDEYSVGDAALYGLTAGALEAGGKYAFKKAMQTLGVSQDALDTAVGKAQKSAAADALSEPDLAKRAAKLANNAEPILEGHQATLDEALDSIGKQLETAPDKLFSPETLRKTVSNNAGRQAEDFLTAATQLDAAAQTLGGPELESLSKSMAAGLDASGAKQFGMMRQLRSQLSQLGKDSPLIQELAQGLEDSLGNEGVWGRAAKNYSELADLSAASESGLGKAGFRLGDEQMRQPLIQHLDLAQSMAKLTKDPNLADAIAKARGVISEADAVTGASMMKKTLAEKLAEKAGHLVENGAAKFISKGVTTGVGALTGGHLGAIAGHAVGDLIEPLVKKGLKSVAPAVAGAVGRGIEATAAAGLRAAPHIGQAAAMGGALGASAIGPGNAEREAAMPPTQEPAAGETGLHMAPGMEDLAEHATHLQKVKEVRQKLDFLKAQKATAIDSAARAVASPVANTRTVPRQPGVSHSTGVQAFLGSSNDLRTAYEDKKQSLQQLSQNPMMLVDDLTESLGSLQDAAPELHAKLVEQTYKVAGYLNDKLPSTIGNSLTRPDGTPPNPFALRQFALYYSAATAPHTVLTDLTHNRAQKEQMDTLRELWPDTYADLKDSVLDQMSQGRPTFAQRSRMDLLFDFGDSLDTALSSRLTAAMEIQRQQGGGKQGAQQGGGGTAAGPKMPGGQSSPSVATVGPLGSLAMGANKAA